MELRVCRLSCLLIFIIGITDFIFESPKAAVSGAKVQEKQVKACNTPCNEQYLSCPTDHSIAIREAAFSVRQQPPSCRQSQTCDGQTLCCAESQTQSCVFSYSPSHLEALHRNCSGRTSCVVRTDRTQEESVACPFYRPETTVSHTVLDYFCINDSIMIDMCMPGETTITGRKLFAHLDWRIQRRDPLGGAVCRCTAESTHWPTTNTIAVFVVDVRLNVARQAQCSETVIMLRSGRESRRLDCVTSRDPRLAFPFVALLNHSNVATMETFLEDQQPEFLWIGFESNEQEDIRLTCGLQGYVPLSRDAEETESNATASVSEESEQHVGAIAGGVAGGVILCFVVAVAVTPIAVRRCKRGRHGQYSEPSDSADVFGDVYYTTPDVITNGQRPSPSMLNRDGKLPPKTTTGSDYYNSGTGGGDFALYISPADVREKKRQIGQKRVRIVSTPDIADNGGDSYSSPLDFRDRRRQQDSDDNDSKPPTLPPKLGAQSSSVGKADAEEGYATLERNRNGSTAENEEADVSYSHLGPAPGGIQRQREHRQRGSYKNIITAENCPEEARCKENDAYVGDDVLD